MPTAERRKREESRRAPQGGTQLVNEQQETIFDTAFSAAADDFAKATMEHRLWAEKKKKAEADLIHHMKENKLTKIVMGGDKVIKYKFVDAKEVITIKDFKPKVPGRRRR